MNIIDVLRNKINDNKYDTTKLCNYTGIGIGKMLDFLKGENNLNEEEFWLLEMRVKQYNTLR